MREALASLGRLRLDCWTLPELRVLIERSILSAGLLFSAGLGLAFAAPSTTLPVQIVPAPSPGPGGTLACDQGPNAASVPGPAQAAGFTHCFLNADFSSNSTDGNGINYSDPATFVLNCGASRGSQNAVWEMFSNGSRELHGNNAQLSMSSCGKAAIVVDPVYGNRMFDFRALKSELSCSGLPGNPNAGQYPTCSGPDIQTFSWPASTFDGNGGGPHNRGVQHAMLERLVYRMPISGLQSDPSAQDQQFLPYAWWYDSCGNSGCPGGGGGGFTEVDFFELFSNTCSGNFCMPGFNTAGSPGTIWNTPFDVTIYNTVDTIYTTPDGVHFTGCQWVNGALQGTGDGSSVGCANMTLGGQSSFGGSLENWTNVGCGFVSPGCNANDIHIYIKEIQVWACDNMWNGACTGPTVSSANESDTKFAARRQWLQHKVMSAATWLAELVLPSALATVN